MRSVDPHKTANAVTGDLSAYAGTHVAYTCEVDQVIRDGVILGQCGPEEEPVDLFVHIATKHLHHGEKYRILGIIERPAEWTDIYGHTVYYAFLNAVFVDPVK